MVRSDVLEMIDFAEPLAGRRGTGGAGYALFRQRVHLSPAGLDDGERSGRNIGRRRERRMPGRPSAVKASWSKMKAQSSRRAGSGIAPGRAFADRL
jgi:hypothetical protein